MKQEFYFVILVGTTIYLGICLLLYLMQDHLIYFPPGTASRTDASDIHLKNEGEDIVISASWKDTGKAIIYFGGNAEDVSFNLPEFKKVFPDYSLYLMNYRGYGGSTGKPSEKNIYSDSVALYRLVKKKHNDISIIGRSLGSGIAVHLASEFPVSKLVLVTPYDSMENMAKQNYPFVPVSLLLRDKYRSLLYAAKIKIPTTIIAARNDNIIPMSNTKRLYDGFRDGIVKMIVIDNAGHNSISGKVEYYSSLKESI